ncbi:DNA-methyltransferase [Nocardia wallacei]|uniref:DNA-methyltransferase n=1 Tax=Nocardia wallacei TaxID=480035 RepID=UPI002453D59C|nr:site-specific DNA-methyltransferase [Nocardia wallacei]
MLAEIADASVDAVVTDPPYGLEFMGAEWDSFRPSSARFRERVDGRTNPRSGKSVTNTPESYIAGVPFGRWCESWAGECLRVLKPGGHLLAFGGTRTWHRLACAIEDAGFELRDSIAWLYGGGFPKSLDVSKAIDKAKRRDFVLAAVEFGLDIPGNSLHDWTKAGHAPGDTWWERFKAHLSREQWEQLERRVVGVGFSGATAGMQNLGPSGITGGDYTITAPATDAAKQWEGWGTALKPAHEPIVVARKPLAGTVAQNVTEHGTGALNIDGCRIDGRERTEYGLAAARRSKVSTYGNPSESADFDASKGRWPANVVLDDAASAGIDAARFFYTAKAGADERPEVDGVRHPTVKPLALMRWLVRLVTPPGGVVLDPFAGSGTTAEACVLEHLRCIAIEREPSYLPLIRARLSKPITLGLDFEGASD